MSQIPWPDDRVAELRELFEAKTSVTVMAKRFGISRGAVIGKLHRLGLKRDMPRQPTAEEILAAKERRRVKHNIAQNKRRRVSLGSGASAAAQRAPVAVLPEVSEAHAPLGIPFADLEPFSQRKPNQCRYMAAEEPAPEYRVCGTETAPGEPYCVHCKVIVHDYRKLSDAEQARLRNLSNRMKAANAGSAA